MSEQLASYTIVWGCLNQRHERYVSQVKVYDSDARFREFDDDWSDRVLRVLDRQGRLEEGETINECFIEAVFVGHPESLGGAAMDA